MWVLNFEWEGVWQVDGRETVREYDRCESVWVVYWSLRS